MKVMDYRIWQKANGFKWIYLLTGDSKTYAGFTKTREEAENIIRNA